MNRNILAGALLACETFVFACSQVSPEYAGTAGVEPANSGDPATEIARFEIPPAVAPTAGVLASAIEATDTVDAVDTADPVEQLSANTPKRTRTIAAMMFDIGGGPPDLTKIQPLLVGTGQSLRHMYNEISYGTQDLQIDFLGPYTLPEPTCLPIECCGPKPTQPNGPEVAQIIQGLPMKYDHYFWVYGPQPAGASCGTWGDEGSAAMPAVYSSYSFDSIVGFSQELGHNFGMTHEPTLTCAGNATFLDDSTQCTHKEYGSTLSFMGSGAHHPSAYHKYQEGWIGKCNVVRAGGSAEFTLVPQELPCDGVQLLQIAAPKTRAAPAKGDRQGNGPTLSYYYAEMRGPYGFDGNLKPQVIISIGADLPTQTQHGSPYLYVLDMKPETNGRQDLTNAGLMDAGQAYTDPAGGLTITLEAIDNTSATIRVDMTGGSGSHTCADQTVFTAPGPGSESCGGVVGLDGGSPPPAGSTGGATGNATGNATGDAGRRDAGLGDGASDGSGDASGNASGGVATATSDGGAAISGREGGAIGGTGNTGGTTGTSATSSGGAASSSTTGADGGAGASSTTGEARGSDGEDATQSAGCACAMGPRGHSHPWSRLVLSLLVAALGWTRSTRARRRVGLQRRRVGLQRRRVTV